MNFLFLLAIVIFPLTGAAQENSRAVLVDEFPATVTCEDVLARTDHLTFRLKETPNSSGVIVFRGYEEALDLKERKHAWPVHFIHRALIASTGNDAVVSMVGVPGTGPSIQFWIVPPGEHLELKESHHIGKIPFEVNERIYYASDDPGPCSGQILRGFVAMLKTNPLLSGYVVNVNVPKNERKRTVRYDLGSFREHGIADRGIRIFFKNIKVLPRDS